MTMKPATRAQLRQAADRLRLSLDDGSLEELGAMVSGAAEMLSVMDGLPDELPPVRYPRTPGHRPPPAENPYNAWYWRTEIRGAGDGPLLGRTVAVKDNIAVAGVPMMSGASTLEGYVPEIDATVVTRVLDAGATISGKAHCEYFCYSGASHTNATGPTRNPYDPARTTGGSSSGPAAVVAAGDVDLAIGGDQGGSIREPSAFCGLYGMKPTHGLVPYTGAMTMEPTIDHLGPMTRTLADNALLLSVLAGPDGLDPRQIDVQLGDYVAGLDEQVAGLRVAVVGEGFDQPGAPDEPRTDEAVRAAIGRLREAGAVVSEISLPEHLLGLPIWAGVTLQGTYLVAMRDAAVPVGVRGFAHTSLADAHAAWKHQTHKLSDNMKLAVLVGEHLTEVYGMHYYAKARNLARRLAAAYDAALADHDVLLMPTTPTVAPRIPPPDAPFAEWFVPGFETIVNTAPFDVTGHPAISVPCGSVDGLPVGLMLVGRRWDERTLYRTATAFGEPADPPPPAPSPPSP